MSARALRRRVECLLLLAAVLAFGCTDDTDEMQELIWSVSGLSEGVLTLTETRSGRSWTIDSDRSGEWFITEAGAPTTTSIVTGRVLGADGRLLVPRETTDPGGGWVVVNSGRPQSRRLEAEFPRKGDGWELTLEVSGAERMTCQLIGEAGMYSERSDDWPLFISTACGVPASSVEIPDPGLALCITSQVPFGVNTFNVRELDCSDYGIDDLSGLDWFHALASLDLSHNAIDTLDSIDWRILGRLSHLDLSHNALTEVDFDRFSYVWGDFDFSHNEIASVDHAWELRPDRLSLRHNQLEAFDVTDPHDPSVGASFVVLDLGYNRLTRLELPRQTDPPRELDVERNQLEVLDLGTDIAVVYYPGAMLRLNAAFNRLTAGPADDPTRRRLELPEMGYVEIDLSHNELTEIPAEYVSEFTRELAARGNAIETIDLSGADALDRLDLAENALAAIEISGAPLLRHLDVADNALDDFDWAGGASQLQELDLSGNPLAAMEDCVAPDLWWLAAEDAGLSSLDLSACPSIEILALAGNALSGLDVSSSPALEEIDLRDNPVTCDAVDHITTTLPGVDLATGPDACVP